MAELPQSEAIRELGQTLEDACNAAFHRVNETPGSTKQDFALLSYISYLHDMVLMLADFYNARIAELQEALDATTDTLDG